MLELRDLSFAYPVGRPLLGGLSFTFRSGGICAVLGPNGTGKTTLLKLLLGILKPSSGEILLSGMPIGRMTAQRRARKLAYIPQDVSLRFPLSVFEFVLLGRKPWFVWGPSPSDVALTGTVLSRLDLDALAERSLANLSGGQRQRVGIAQALLGDPEILILDEPTAGLDPEERIRFRGIISNLSQQKTVLLSTHIVSDLEAVANEVILLQKGNILAVKKPFELLEQLNGHVWVISVPTSEETALTKAYACSNVMHTDGRSVIRVLSERKPHPGATLITPNMEDMYLYYFGR